MSLRMTAMSSAGQSQSQSQVQPRKMRLNPCLLSSLSAAFCDRIALGTRTKHGLDFADSFTGAEAVDKLAYLIKTADRNLALLAGRALDAQKLFHDVNYEVRLRDSEREVYRFRSNATATSAAAGNTVGSTASSSIADDNTSLYSLYNNNSPDDESLQSSIASLAGLSFNSTYNVTVAEPIPEPTLPIGVFTLLAACYSPTCSSEYSCYSISCPRRIHKPRQSTRRISQQTIGNGSSKNAFISESSGAGMFSATTSSGGPHSPIVQNRKSSIQAPLSSLPYNNSTESLLLADDSARPTTAGLWVESVPPEVLASTSDSERKRQEAINELIYTERDFVRDLEYLRDTWMGYLLQPNSLHQGEPIMPQEQRQDFVREVFWNIPELIAVSRGLSDSLSHRQSSQHLVSQVGDILLRHIPEFNPFVTYGAHQLFAKVAFEKQKASNGVFAAWVEEKERAPESRKLELNGYLTKPTTRLARYPLLLEVIIKHTPIDHPDAFALPECIRLVRALLSKVNVESGRSENTYTLSILSNALIARPGELNGVNLQDPTCELLYKGSLKRKGEGRHDTEELQVYLLDHALLMIRSKIVNKVEQMKLFRRPIALELLIISTGEHTKNIETSSLYRQTTNRSTASSTTMVSPSLAPSVGTSKTVNSPISLAPKDPKLGYPIYLVYLGRSGYEQVLYAPTITTRNKWIEVIQAQQYAITGARAFEPVPLSQGFFAPNNMRVSCAAAYERGSKILYGTGDGVYFQDLRESFARRKNPIKVVEMRDITQMAIIERPYDLLVLLADGCVYTIPMLSLSPKDPKEAVRRSDCVATHTTFFRYGICQGDHIVLTVKSSALSSTMKIWKPIDTYSDTKKPGWRIMANKTQAHLLRAKEFYIPAESSSIHCLKTKLCAGTVKGFEIVDPNTLETQALLDPRDPRLDFVLKRENIRPLSIYKRGGDFLLCYDEFAFFVNKMGYRSRTGSSIVIYWEGRPRSFAFHNPYVLAFDPDFVEIRHVETGDIVQIIRGENIRLLYENTMPATADVVQQRQHYAQAMQQWNAAHEQNMKYWHMQQQQEFQMLQRQCQANRQPFPPQNYRPPIPPQRPPPPNVSLPPPDPNQIVFVATGGDVFSAQPGLRR